MRGKITHLRKLRGRYQHVFKRVRLVGDQKNTNLFSPISGTIAVAVVAVDAVVVVVIVVVMIVIYSHSLPFDGFSFSAAR